MSSEFFLRVEEIEAILKNFDEKKYSKDRKFRNALREATYKELKRFSSKELAYSIIHYILSRG